MIKNKKILCIASAVFLVCEAVLGVLLQTASGRAVSVYAYTSVVLACLLCVLFAERSRSYALTQTALMLTLCADYFLVLWFMPNRLYGMLFFSVAQLAYFLRIYFEDDSKTRKKWHLWLRVGLSVGILPVTWAVLREDTDALALVSMLYYVNLILNLVFSALQWRRQWLLAVGFLLFLLCDTVIGVTTLWEYFPISSEGLLYDILHPDFNLAWVFYLPSQALLAISLLPSFLSRKKRSKTE